MLGGVEGMEGANVDDSGMFSIQVLTKALQVHQQLYATARCTRGSCCLRFKQTLSTKCALCSMSWAIFI
jgi:hypothetical protein